MIKNEPHLNLLVFFLIYRLRVDDSQVKKALNSVRNQSSGAS